MDLLLIPCSSVSLWICWLYPYHHPIISPLCWLYPQHQHHYTPVNCPNLSCSTQSEAVVLRWQTTRHSPTSPHWMEVLLIPHAQNHPFYDWNITDVINHNENMEVFNCFEWILSWFKIQGTSVARFYTFFVIAFLEDPGKGPCPFRVWKPGAHWQHPRWFCLAWGWRPGPPQKCEFQQNLGVCLKIG